MSAVWDPVSLIGTRLGSCIIEQLLGVGGMGVVYLAQQEHPRRHVALKVLRPQPAGDEQAQSVFLARFRREADASAALDHAHIVPVYESGEEQGVAYLVMPYLADGSLAALVARRGQLPLLEVVGLVEQAAAALDYAHAQGIVHRDVKPSNLLLHPDGRLLLADFGIARPTRLAADEHVAAPGKRQTSVDATPADGELTQAGAALGTPEYMAPEQVRGELVTPATDIYALGVVAYMLLAGHTPFGEEDVAAVLRSQLSALPPSLRAIRPDLPPRVEEAISHALAKSPSGRPDSAGGLAQALRDACRGRLFSLSTRLSAAQESLAGALQRGGTSKRRLTAPRQLAPIPTFSGATEALPHIAHVQVSFPVSEIEAPTLADISSAWQAPAAQWPVLPRLVHAPTESSTYRRSFWRIPLPLLAAMLALLVIVGVAAGGLGASLARSGTTYSVPQSTATPGLAAGWLRLAPASLALGCSSADRAKPIILHNRGPVSVTWQASVTRVNGAFPVSLVPHSGILRPSGSATVYLLNISQSAGRSGVVRLVPSSPGAGAPATLVYLTRGCQPSVPSHPTLVPPGSDAQKSGPRPPGILPPQHIFGRRPRVKPRQG